MNCPVCKKEMEQGFLGVGGGYITLVDWTKTKRKLFLCEGDLSIMRKTLSGARLTGHICRDCKKIVFDYSDQEVKDIKRKKEPFWVSLFTKS